jgi:hypothetical protein
MSVHCIIGAMQNLWLRGINYKFITTAINPTILKTTVYGRAIITIRI